MRERGHFLCELLLSKITVFSSLELEACSGGERETKK